MKTIRIFITLLLLSSLSLTAQNKDTRVADKYFTRFEFNKAIEAYGGADVDPIISKVDVQYQPGHNSTSMGETATVLAPPPPPRAAAAAASAAVRRPASLRSAV